MRVLKQSLYSLMLVLVLLPAAIFAAPDFVAPDYAREQRWADEVIPGLIIGDAIYLQQKNLHSFLGIYAQADDALMGVIVVHGMGLHPDWGMIGTLRQRLYDFGYTTLSLQMPILAADASYKAYPHVFPEAMERLQLGVAHLKKQGYQRIAVVSHSNGSRMSRVYMANNPVGVHAWVALSLTQGDTFTGIKSPVLDLYGENDLPHVLKSKNKRKKSLNANKMSQQIMIPRADHFFSEHEEEMIEMTKNFLASVN